MRVFIPRFLGAIVYLVALTLVGAVGYVAIEGWQWHEALYTTVIAITAVGFQEVHPLSELGRDFTMVLLAAGITGLAVWFALITSLILEFDLSDVRRRRWRVRMLETSTGTWFCVAAVERVGKSRRKQDSSLSRYGNRLTRPVPSSSTRQQIPDSILVMR